MLFNRSPLFSVVVNFMMIVIFKYNVVAKKEIYMDLPIRSDFDRYLSALEKVVDFCARHKNYVDVNMKFGLFLIDVNLRKLVEQKRANKTIPQKIHSRLDNLFLMSDALSEYYRSMVMKNETEENIKMALLFYNATSWQRPPDKFTVDLLHQTERYNLQQLEKKYGDWKQYSDLVNNTEPLSAESDKCIVQLVQGESLRSKEESQRDCRTTPHCKHLIEYGNDFGYVLTHRILYMMFTRFYGKCYVFSEVEDKNKTDEYCLKCFYEAEFIGLNSFNMPDLIFEIIATCTIFGHAQFLRNDWLNRGLVFQSKEGCFSEEVEYDDRVRRTEGDSKEWKIERQLTIMHGKCDIHFTAVAVGALSNALRYIIEEFS